MVNKSALAVLGVIVLVSMGLGILIGLQIDNAPGVVDGGSGGNGSDDGPTPIPVSTTAAATPTPTPTPTSTATPTTASGSMTTERPARTTVSYRRFDPSLISREVKFLINQRRRSLGLSELQSTGTTPSRLDEMAKSHSVAMANEGVVSHTVNGVTSAQRYRNQGLFDTCRFESGSDSFILNPTESKFEVITLEVAGRAYTDGGQTEFAANETAVAQQIVETWFEQVRFRERLTYENAAHIGIGIEVTQDGSVYATGNVC